MDLTVAITIILLTVLFSIVLFILIARYRNLRVTVNECIKDKIILKIAVPIKNEKGPVAAEQLFQSLHGILRGANKSTDHYSLEIVGASYGIYFIAVVDPRYKKFIENQIYAQYPTAQISKIKDYTETLNNSSGQTILVSELGLSQESYLPIKTFQSFEVDPLASITSAISKLEPGYEAWIQIVIRPIDNSWQNKGKSYVDALKGRKTSEGESIPLVSGESQELAEIETKNNKVGFQFIIRILAKGSDPVTTQHILEDTEASFKQFQTGQANSLSKLSIGNSFLRNLFLGKRMNEKLDAVSKYTHRLLDEKTEHILNTEEIASIYHLPNESVKTPNISWAMSKKLEYPKNLPTKNARIYAYTDYRNIHIPFGIKHPDRKRHIYILGKTGTGKSTLLKTMIGGDILEGKGVGVIDPHGDLVEDILKIIPPERVKDVVLIDPSDVDFPIGLNMLDLKEGESKELLADGIVSVFKKYFDSWGPRLQYILTNTILTLLNCQNVSLLAVQRILVDPNYRTFLLKQVKDPFIVKFWEDEFDKMNQNPRMLVEAIAPIQNKVGRFLSSTMVRNMFGQIKSSINLQEIMDSGKILLVNLSQGKIGEENSSLLGGLIVTRLYSNAMQRALIPENQRKDFYLYVDEFQNFATDTFIKILSEARKYALNLIVTHQYIDQIEPQIQNAIFGNVGTLMNYVVGQQDASKLEQEYSPYLDQEDLVNLDRFRMAVKLTIDGAQSHPFTGISIKQDYPVQNTKQQILDFNHENYSTPRDIVEQKLNKWAHQQYSKNGNLVQQTKELSDSQDNKKKKYKKDLPDKTASQEQQPIIKKGSTPPQSNQTQKPQSKTPRGPLQPAM